MPGDYAYPFQFKLPNRVGGTSKVSDPSVPSKPKAKLQYLIKAKLETVSKLNGMKYKHPFVLRDLDNAIEKSEQKMEYAVYTMMCIG